ncbi:CD3337/EF1877 family mobilome membrane protein [Lactiplantibacillus plantarum]|uniref:CD3337/EF1877 family mobilome membrane protein n=1 Tax=Lactiplantibacillus plantarum TaxID=1590 RepID=UPI0032E01D1C
MSARKKRLLLLIGFVLIVVLVSATSLQSVHAAGLVDETVNNKHEFSKYPVNNYQLDYFVDSSWDWLPWNWGDGIGKSVMYAIYAITNFLWLISVYLSYATGYLIQQAYSLDFIKDTTDAIGKNMQLLAGVSKNGFSADGFYPGMLLLLILVLGVYVAYTGLIKRESSKAISAVVNFVVIFILSASFIAYSPDYIGKINQFSADMSTSALNTGSKMIMQNKQSTSKNGVDAIRETLFNIQVKQPWTLLQFGDSNLKEVGEDRVNKLVKTDPFKNKGKDRTEIVKAEIEAKENDNLSAVKTIQRLGVTTFVCIFDIAITIFVFFLTAMMLFSQILFIIYAIFLPISCLLAMIPGFNGLMKTAVLRLFNTIMMRAGVTIVLTLTFCLSTMIYGLSTTTPFFLVAFLQIVIFAGIWMKLGDLMGMMQLKSSDSQAGASRLRRSGSRLIRQVMGNAAMGGMLARGLKPRPQPQTETGTDTTGKGNAKRPQSNKRDATTSKMTRAGKKVGAALDTKKKMATTAKRTKEQLKDLPTNTKYGLHQGKETAKKGIDDFKNGLKNQRQDNQSERELAAKKRREEMQRRKLIVDPPKNPRQPSDSDPIKKRPTVSPVTQPKPRDPSTTKLPHAKVPIEKPILRSKQSFTTTPKTGEKRQFKPTTDKPLNLVVNKATMHRKLPVKPRQKHDG